MLEAIGVTAEQEQVFRALLAAPRRTVDQIAAYTGLEVDRVCLAATDLEVLGFLTRTPDQPSRFVPVRPDSAVEVLVAQRKLELDRIAAAAGDLVREMEVEDRHKPDNLLEVVVGREAISARFAQLLNVTDNSLLVLDRPPYAAQADTSEQQVRGLLKDGVVVRGIYSTESLDLPGSAERAISAGEAGETSRVHPRLPMKLAIFDQRVALLPLSVDRLIDSALVVHESALLKALLEMFELLWADAKPIGGGRDMAADGRLLTLMAAGLKDEAIARQLRVSPRTVGRRVAELMDRLGARTRFQAGLYAQRRFFSA